LRLSQNIEKAVRGVIALSYPYVVDGISYSVDAYATKQAGTTSTNFCIRSHLANKFCMVISSRVVHYAQG